MDALLCVFLPTRQLKEIFSISRFCYNYSLCEVRFPLSFGKCLRVRLLSHMEKVSNKQPTLFQGAVALCVPEEMCEGPG